VLTLSRKLDECKPLHSGATDGEEAETDPVTAAAKAVGDTQDGAEGGGGGGDGGGGRGGGGGGGGSDDVDSGRVSPSQRRTSSPSQRRVSTLLAIETHHGYPLNADGSPRARASSPASASAHSPGSLESPRSSLGWASRSFPDCLLRCSSTSSTLKCSVWVT